MVKNNKWTDKELELLREIYSVKTAKELVGLFPRHTYYSISSLCSDLGLLKSKATRYRAQSEGRRQYYANDNYFNEIDTSNKAYVLGMLVADGYNNEKANGIKLSLSSKDRHILNDIKDELEYDGVLYEDVKRNQTTLRITSKQISEDLARKHGCWQAKSLNALWPTTVPDKYIRDFIRGLIDGDGSIYQRRDGQFCFSFIGTKAMCIGLMDTLIENVVVGDRLLRPIKMKFRKNTWTFTYKGTKQTYYICKYLYESMTSNDLKLNRKYNKWLQIQPTWGQRGYI